MTVYFSADLHVGHRRIIELCKRPYGSLDEMNADLIANWNAVVKPTDSIWFLGDFAWHGSEHFFYQLNGEKHLIIGNHDGKDTLALPWASQEMYRELAINEDGVTTKLVLFHYPIRSWDGAYKGRIHLYGHVHGKLSGTRLCLDVGVDCWDFRPVTLSEIKVRLATLPEWSP